MPRLSSSAEDLLFRCQDFHYGHVREEESYKIKKQDILRIYHNESVLPKYQKRERRFDAMDRSPCLFRTHPKFMKERILRLENFWTPQNDLQFLLRGTRQISRPDSFLKSQQRRLNGFQSMESLTKILE